MAARVQAVQSDRHRSSRHGDGPLRRERHPVRAAEEEPGPFRSADPLMSDFVHLHVHSQYSLLDAVCPVEDLADVARLMGMPALAGTDNGNLFGAIQFYDACLKAGVKPIIGAEVYVAPASRFERSTHGLPGASHPLVLLCENEQGYRNLIELVSIGYLEWFYYRPRVDKESLRKFSKGLIALSGGIRAELP